ncbi:hypothetical protein [Hymenobacter sp. BT491]|uniref:hypothetical protein n=1 Tax=Hymenobacter sp. BT491 TaxID=2766779 RepID=UPI0016538CF4|nr:hypothetical protein [Hymenobacter sp. BT491]MBC6992515.1 hypothetical protein [Hymenobacter sp. BT491]
MRPTAPDPAPVGFPDPSLTIPYADGLRYAQYRLKMFGRGDLKPFCQRQALPYTTVVNLKNGTLKSEEIRLVQRLLRSLAVPVEIIRLAPDHKTHRFLFPTPAALGTFQRQLKGFDSGVSPLDQTTDEPSPN